MPGHHWQDMSALQSAESAAEGQDEMQLALVDAQYPAPHHWHEGLGAHSPELVPSAHDAMHAAPVVQ
jgi:hypothetical protein